MLLCQLFWWPVWYLRPVCQLCLRQHPIIDYNRIEYNAARQPRTLGDLLEGAMAVPTIEPQVRINLRRRLPLLLLALLGIASLLLPSRVWTTLLIGLGGLIIVAYAWARQLAKGLQGSRRLRFGWVSVGDRLSEEFVIVNDCLLPALWVEIVDASNVPGYQAAVVRSVNAGTVDRWRGSAVCTRRGQFQLGPWALRSADPFGLFEIIIPYPETEQIVIHPPIYSRAPIPLPAGHSSGRSRARSPSWQATINAASVRAYRPADPRRWIHWPTTAHRDELFVRQFDLDAAGDIWLVIDLQADIQLGQGADGTEEFAVLLAATLSAQALDQNRATGLATYGRQPQLVAPNRGQGQQWKLLQALAVMTADGEHALSRALQDVGQIARRGSAVIIITPSGRADWLPDLLPLAQRSVRPHVVLLDRASFTPDASSAPDIPSVAGGGSVGLRDAVRDLGFEATLVKQGELGKPIEEQERRGYWEFLVTGTGKAVPVRSPFE